MSKHFTLVALLLFHPAPTVDPVEFNPPLIEYVEEEFNYDVPPTRDIIFSTFNDDIFSQSRITKNMLTLRDGLYYYGDYLAIATASTKLGQVPSGYTTHVEGDTLVFVIEGELYEGIVIDVCGACMGLSHENNQRIDVLSTGSWLKKGFIYD